jgi:hypothetical protein
LHCVSSATSRDTAEFVTPILTCLSAVLQLMDSYHSLFCRQCYRYDCHFHSYRPLPGMWAASAMDTRTTKSAPPPCGESCGKGDAALSSLSAAAAAATSGTTEPEEGASAAQPWPSVVLGSTGDTMVRTMPKSDAVERCDVCACVIDVEYWCGETGTEQLCHTCASHVSVLSRVFASPSSPSLWIPPRHRRLITLR